MKKNSNEKSFFFSGITGAGFCAAAAVSLAVQIYLAGNISAEESSLQAFRSLLLWGGIINIGLFAAAFIIVLLRGRKILEKLNTISALVRPLAKKNFSALGQIPAPQAETANTADSSDPNGNEIDENELAASLRSLGKLLESLKLMVERSAEMGNVLRDDDSERDAVFKHLGDLTDKIANQFFEIESSVDQGIESLGSIDTYLDSLNSNSGSQSATLEAAEIQLEKSSELSNAASVRIEKSAAKAELLRTEIGTGEEQAQEVNDLVRNISREVEGISEMTAIINQISEQTNMLSMNAAIESAHAGQAGKGFAVVAEEIRKLAESTKENAARIHEEVLSITKNTQGALKASESSFGTFNTLTGKIGELAKELAEISSAAKETGGINANILSAIKETSAGNMRLRDSSVDIIAHSQSFKGSLDIIKSLSETTRAEIKEIHSGTAEILDNIKNTQNRIINDLDETEKISSLIPVAEGITAITKKVDSEYYSDSRDVAVKHGPKTVF
jgi:methyl-accepting chemotaxis protein